METRVMNLRTGKFTIYCLPPFEAVRAAYAQYQMHDWNTWGYAQYDHAIEKSKRCYAAGDFAAFIDQAKHKEVY